MAHMSTRGDRSRPAPDRAGDADAAKTSRRARRDTGYVGESPADDDEVGRSIPRGDAAVEDVTVAMRHLRTVEEAEEATAEEEDRGAHADDERDDDDAMATARPEPRGEWTTKPATETSWRGDGRVAAWLAERERKANKRALGPLRRARKELEWITRRRSAQIANYRRDRKIEIEEQREAMAQAKVASYGAAAKDGADVVTTNDRVGVIEDAAAVIERSRAIARLPARVSVPRFNAAGGARRTTRGGRKKKTSAALPWVTAPARANRRSRTDGSQRVEHATPTARGSSTSEASGSRLGCSCRWRATTRRFQGTPRGATRRCSGARPTTRGKKRRRGGGEPPTFQSFSSEGICLGICSRLCMRERRRRPCDDTYNTSD